MLIAIARNPRLGNSGLRVSELSLGTMTFGEDWGWGAAKDEARKIYDLYREQGGNFIDTANVYTNGSSERIVGDFVRDHRDQVVIATKYTNDVAALAGQSENRLHRSLLASYLGFDDTDR